MHEHIFLLSPDSGRNCPQNWGDEELRIQDAVAQLRKLYQQGVRSMVDMTVAGSGRHVPRIKKIAEQVDLNILVATGFYTFNELPIYLQNPRPDSLENSAGNLLNMMLKDIHEGIEDTGIKAAILKCATDRPSVTPGVERVLRAVAQAQRITGLPVYTHTYAKTRSGLDQQRIFEEEGANLSRVVIGHCGDTTDINYLTQLLGKGSYLGMDRFGIDTILPLRKRVETVAALCRLGYARKIILSQDAACYNDWFPEESLAKMVPNWNFLHILKDVVPALKERGVTDDQISTMLVDNPRRIFEGNA
jgi:phosphotriesterase-related protein